MGLNLSYIEGQTPIDEDEKIGLKIKTISTKNELDEWEQLNIEEAIKWSMKIKKPVEQLISAEFVKDLHKRMYAKVWKWAGQFRNTNKNIGVDKYRIGIDLKMLCDDFMYWHNNNIFTPQERVIRFKHRIVAIHCFPNGNGRHSRLIADILISKLYGEPVFSWGGSQNLSSDSDIRKAYLQALREADKGNYTPLIEFAI
jgi:Fic-DOC domain mobile mystery protein B